MNKDLTAAYFKYGTPALINRLLALPERSDKHNLSRANETRQRTSIECDIVDDWATNLFVYCLKRSASGLRMVAILSDAERSIAPGDPARIGLYPTWSTLERIREWHRLAMRMPAI
jgi:hypothetical protein